MGNRTLMFGTGELIQDEIASSRHTYLISNYE